MRDRVIGLFGGSFDPAHAGHVALTKHALRQFGLDQVWWLVTPGNPLKSHGPAPLAMRMAQARAKMKHPQVRVTDIEAQLGTTYTAETIAVLQDRFVHTQFVWLMGADNLAQFDQWKDWRQIMETIPIGVIARPAARLSPLSSRAARIYRNARVPAKKSRLLGNLSGPAWCYLNMPLMPISSSTLRSEA
ncbi:MAG: nicotinate-nucleotide adenylyltransferase [Paracoccaceae bacterium]|nr:nicotinate-nucleotide adenylyltransferase [Paracoccaceae bacterium]